jgi:hypothetical protein
MNAGLGIAPDASVQRHLAANPIPDCEVEFSKRGTLYSRRPSHTICAEWQAGFRPVRLSGVTSWQADVPLSWELANAIHLAVMDSVAFF